MLLGVIAAILATHSMNGNKQTAYTNKMACHESAWLSYSVVVQENLGDSDRTVFRPVYQYDEIRDRCLYYQKTGFLSGQTAFLYDLTNDLLVEEALTLEEVIILERRLADPVEVERMFGKEKSGLLQ